MWFNSRVALILDDKARENLEAAERLLQDDDGGTACPTHSPTEHTMRHIWPRLMSRNTEGSRSRQLETTIGMIHSQTWQRATAYWIRPPQRRCVGYTACE